MRKFFGIFGNVKMTTAIAALVLMSIIGSIAAVSGAIYFSLHAQSITDSEAQQETNLAVAATILERRISGSVLNWTEEGTMDAFQSWAIPPFYDSEIIDSVTRVTRQDATIYVLDSATQALVGKTTSLVAPDGTRVADLALDATLCG
jgi:methyl-accepting chemotaxis protein